MQTFYKRFSVVAGFAVLLAIILANAFVTKGQMDRQILNQTRVSHTRQFLYELSQTQSLVTDAETGQRGFLYTGDAKYLAPYTAASKELGTHLDKLENMAASDPQARELAAELRVLSGRKLDELAQSIAFYNAGQKDEAKALVQSDVGLFRMDKIREVVDKMETDAAAIEGQRLAEYQRSIRDTAASIYLASLVGALGLVVLAFYILREMETRDAHSAEIRAREEWFRVTLTSIGDAVIATDEHGRVSFLNPVAEKLTGMSLAAANGKTIQEVFPIFNEITHKPVEDPVEKVLKLGTVVGLANHTVLRNVDGTLVPIEDSAAPIRDSQNRLLGVVLVFRDVTSERNSQVVMRKTEKLAAAARLSATVAHEINNPLEAVMNLVYIARLAPDTPPAVAQNLVQAEQELERIAHLTRQTLGFYRESNQPEQVDVPELIESVLRLYSNRLKNKSIVVDRDFGDCPLVLGSAGELRQVVSNLISNAADAVKSNGHIRVRLRCIEDETGKSVQLIVEDDGPGVAAENIDRIFEPFFTTKEDVGTGLGLWITREIVSRHGGNITVRSRGEGMDSSGAAFTILLPVNFDSQPADREAAIVPSASQTH